MSEKAETRKTLLVFGIGKLGGPLVDILATRFPQHKYVVVSRNGGRSELRANLTRYLCAQWGTYPEVQWDATDLLNVDQTSALIDRHRPDIIFNATTPFPWWQIDQMPETASRVAHQVGPGMWCALDCLLPMKVSESLETSGTRAVYLNGCYPDMVNAFLNGSASAPLLGIGNLSNLVPGLKLAFGRFLGAHPRDIAIRLICHHFTSLNTPTVGTSCGAPYLLTVGHPEGDLRFDGTDDTPFALVKSKSSRVRGLEGQGVTVSSAATVLASLLNGEQGYHHAPGPLGLPGGYPVKLSENGDLSLDLPEGTSRDDAVEINTRAQKFDGVEEVLPGKVVPTEAAREALRALLGVNVSVVNKQNVLPISREVVDRLNTIFGLSLDPFR